MEVAEEMNAACQGIQYEFTSVPPHLNGNAPTLGGGGGGGW